MATIYIDPADVPRCEKVLFSMDYGRPNKCGMKHCPHCNRDRREDHDGQAD